MKIYDTLASSILNRLEKEFHKQIVQSSMVILKTPNITTKFSNFATNIRELTREVFYTLAPDNEVKKCNWYKKETTEGEADITRIQRMTYAIKGGLSDQFIKDELQIDFNNVTSRLNQVIRNLNKYTHINEKVYFRDENDGYEMVEKTLVAFDNFLKTIDDLRTVITNGLEERLYYEISEALTADVIQEVDILATHYWIEGSTINNITVSDITSMNIYLILQGSIEVKHQYGSDGDFRRGNGVRFESSYPFHTELKLDINYPLEITIDPYNILVDTSSFYE